MKSLPFKICSSDSGFELNISENGLVSNLEFGAIFNSGDSVRVVIKLNRVIAAKISPFGGDPNSFERIGCVADSEWLKEIVICNEKYFPDSSSLMEGLTHFYFRGSDSTVDVICEGFDWEKL